ncbi:alpha/beta fold hydrolase [Bacteroides sp. 51]|uniref:alpha/beta hydrolase n=1 Tax=Bacteroides sp. 51 TaxID=2302938 RepID=UPI0013D4E566|nr:alpha/beta fold hydrolase [Bacteroides sp. 51]NDV81214.1 alpha/beta fold hydrolase [Bacteroides sp. 51]
MLKKYSIIILLCLPLSALFAQQQHMQCAKELLEFTLAGQGDSVHVRLNEEVQKAVVPAVFSQTLQQLESQFGKYQSHGDWQTDTAGNITLYYTDVQFEKYALRFITAFDADGKANTIRFAPVPAPSTASAIKMNEAKMEEKPIEVVCGKFRLPGTLTLPKGMNNVPVTILVHGSGPQDRDETIGPNKPFRDLAWGLAGRGIASIRYDKRTKVYGAGYAEGGGTYDEETVDDALAAVELAKTIKTLDAKQIYIIGHSLGAMLAPRMAEQSKDLAGIIMMAGNARPFEELLPEQIAYIASLQDSSPETKKQIEELKVQVANVKKLGTDGFDENTPLPMNIPRSYWEFSNSYKQVEVAKKLSLPILILQGERDYQVTMEDFGLWRFGLFRNPNVAFKSYPQLNHLFHEGSGKATPFEYNKEAYMPKYVLDDIAGWIKDKKSINQ